MSSTDKTRPVHAKLLDDPELFLAPWHFHEGTHEECDLPARPSRHDPRHHSAWDGATTRCCWVDSDAAMHVPAIRYDVVYRPTTPTSRRVDRRRERAQGRTASSAGLVDHENDLGDRMLFHELASVAADLSTGEQENVEDYYALARLTRLLDLPEGHHVVESTWEGMVTVMAPDGTRTQHPAGDLQDRRTDTTRQSRLELPIATRVRGRRRDTSTTTSPSPADAHRGPARTVGEAPPRG